MHGHFEADDQVLAVIWPVSFEVQEGAFIILQAKLDLSPDGHVDKH